MSKKLQEKQARRLAEERRLAEKKKEARRRNLITLLITAIVLGGTVFLIIKTRQEESGPVTTLSEEEAGCTEVQTSEPMESPHIAVGAPHEPYNSDPPTSGPHYEAPDGPVDPSFYTSALEPEQVVHNLEHGQVVIWYRPDVDGEIKDQLERVVEQESGANVALPYEGLDDSYSFALTAWGKSQSCTKVSQEVVDEFRKEFQGKVGPEARLTRPFGG